ncbi:MAG TPA: NAD+ synthase [Acidimicrobiia bacterium]|nr:NAD+ synthase [Acidimicrobiia bacterium]
MPRIRVAAAQINVIVGDLEGNADRILAAYAAAEAAGADLVVFPELCVTGYPPEDLLLRPAFVAGAIETLEKIAARTGRCAAVVGFPERSGGRLYNAAAVCADGRVHGVYRKRLLPNYAVFDEQRYFVVPAEAPTLFTVAGATIGVSICEDAWSASGPIRTEADGGAALIVNLNASPYYEQRLAERETMLAGRATEAGVPIVYANLVGGQDELVFDGASLVVDASGAVVARAKQFVEDLLVVDVDVRARTVSDPLPTLLVSDAAAERTAVAARLEPVLPRVQEVYEALVLGTRDYVRKNGFTDVLIGLSGGVDSSLVAAVAVDALGADHVVGVLMPSRYSSDHSITDAEALATSLGIATHVVPIEPAHAAFETMLAPVFEGTAPNLAEENVQARIRGNVLMTISNKFGWMVLTTGNKSEMATGYATLYGDMAGGYAVIKDVPKTLVFELCRDLNARAGREMIPRSVIDKPPSAELAPDQLDSDSLPPYEVLDPIIEGYVEADLSVAELIAAGHDADIVRRVARLIDRNEYKRRQAAPGVRVSPKAFGKDRRLPITNRWPG